MSQKAEQLRLKMADLESALAQQLPEFRTVLRDIHDALKQDPEVNTILSDEERGIIVRGLKMHVNESIVSALTAKKTSTAGVAKKLKGKSEDDIMGMLGG